MKVRIDFTATSSDSCTAEVRIDNPVLTELLKEYDQEFSLEDCYDGACLRTERGRVWSIALESDDCWGTWDDQMPCSLSEVFDCFLEVMSYEVPDPAALEKKLLKRRKDIDKSYKEVFWSVAWTASGSSVSYNDIQRAFGDQYDPHAGYESTTATSTFTYTPKAGERFDSYFEAE